MAIKFTVRKYYQNNIKHTKKLNILSISYIYSINKPRRSKKQQQKKHTNT